jgi:hypothetical protein
MMLSSQPTAHSIIHVPDEHLPGVFNEYYRVRDQIGSKTIGGYGFSPLRATRTGARR